MATGQQLDIPAPRPWRLEGQAIWDADGACVVSALNPASMATRRLIVEAVNGFADALAHADECSRAAAAERAARARDVEDAQREANLRADRLSDMVRRLAEYIRRGHCNEVHIDCADTRKSYHVRAADLLREAEAETRRFDAVVSEYNARAAHGELDL